MPTRLANDSYQGLRLAPDDGERLNLSWTLDERPFLDVDVEAVVRRCLDEATVEPDADSAAATRDLADAAAGHLGLSTGDFVLRCAAGVIGLLHALARVPTACSVACLGEVYPDFPHWVAQRGLHAIPGRDLDRDARPAIVLLDRPGLVDGRFDDLDAVASLCHRMSRHDGIVVVDESYANYWPPAFSSARLLPSTNNLVVLRGMSKGYGLGSLRVGLALIARPLADDVGGLVPAGTVSTLSLRIAASLLATGDVTKGLRRAIAQNGPRVGTVLKKVGDGETIIGRPGLPHVFIGDGTEVSPLAGRLTDVGIQGKYHHAWCGDSLDEVRRFRLAIPLRSARLDSFVQRAERIREQPRHSPASYGASTSHPDETKASTRISMSTGSRGRSKP
jgi:histidinol-phosphate aminotransferase